MTGENSSIAEFTAQRDICSLVGLALVEVQGAEKLLKACVGIVFEDADGNPLEDMRDPKKRRKTLGYFMNVMRQKSDIEPAFDTILSNFLDRRNQFVHDLLGEKLFSLTSATGRYHIRLFLERLRSESDIVGKFMLGALMVWADPEKFADLSKVRVQFPEGSWLGDAEQIFAPHVARMVRPKRDEPPA